MLRKTPSRLVKEAIANGSWYDRLPLEDKKYVREVVGEIERNPNAAISLVAKQLIDILSIKRGVRVVERTLRELMQDGKK